MQREIKFRGKRVDTGEWVYGYLSCIWERKYILWGTTNNIPNMNEVIPETVSQYTGLKDRNNNDIYDGDVLDIRYFLTRNLGVIKFGKYKQVDMTDQYECGHQGFYVDVTNDTNDVFRHDLYFYAEKSEVIGNIFENPELLQEVDT